MTKSNPPQLNITDSETPEVPTFGCVVYVKRIDGGCAARLGNLADMKIVGASEREAVGQLVTAFKAKAKETIESGHSLDWIDPPLPIEDGEQKRFLPVHL